MIQRREDTLPNAGYRIAAVYNANPPILWSWGQLNRISRIYLPSIGGAPPKAPLDRKARILRVLCAFPQTGTRRSPVGKLAWIALMFVTGHITHVLSGSLFYDNIV